MPPKMHLNASPKLISFSLKAISAAVVSALLFTNANAAGLGKLTVLSSLGQPLFAEIELTAVSKDEVGALVPKLASVEAFRQANIEFNPALFSLRFAIEQRGSRQLIRITSAQPINEPFVDMLLELGGGSSRLVREYTFLLDPADLRSTQSPQVTRPITLPPADLARREPEPVRQDSIPSAPPAERPAKMAPPPQVRAVERPAPRAPAAAAPVKTAASVAEVEVKPGDSLSKIAGRVKPEGVSLDQMLVAMYRANPDAFAGNNMNRLRAGQILSVPDAEKASSTSTGEAHGIIIAQAADFNSYRNKLAGQVAAAPAPAQKSLDKAAASGKITAVVKDTTAPTPSKDKLKVGSPGATGKEAKSAISAGAEDEIANKKAIADAKSRVKDLENNVKKLQELMAIKDKNLAAQQKLIEDANKKFNEQQKQLEAAKLAAKAAIAAAAKNDPKAAAAMAAAQAKAEADAKAAAAKAAADKAAADKAAAAKAAADKAAADKLAADKAAADKAAADKAAADKAAAAKAAADKAAADKVAADKAAADKAAADKAAADKASGDKAAADKAAADKAAADKAAADKLAADKAAAEKAAADAAKAKASVPASVPASAPASVPPPASAPASVPPPASAAASVPPKPPVPAEPETEWYDYWPWLAGVLALGGIGYGAFAFVSRRKKVKQNFEESIVTDSSLKANSLFGSTGGQSVDTNNSVFNSNFTPSSHQLDTNEVDPVAEADVYIAYGRDAQAEEILKEALRTQPTRNAVRVKLLEIYSNRKDLRAFEILATELYSMTKGEGDDWIQAASLGIAIDPNNPLYAAGKLPEDDFAQPSSLTARTQPLDEPDLDALLAVTQQDDSLESVNTLENSPYFGNTSLQPGVTSPPAPHIEPEPTKIVSAPATPPSNELDFDLDGLGSLEVPNTIAKPPPPDPKTDFGSIDFDFLQDPSTIQSEEIAHDEPLAPLPPITEAKPVVQETLADDFSLQHDFSLPVAEAPAPTPAVENAMPDFDLSDITLELNPTTTGLETAKPSAPAESALDAAPLALDIAVEEEHDYSNSAEMATKLDLAVAYQEIGDKDGARELLDEVVKGGTPEQIDKAKAILQKFA